MKLQLVTSDQWGRDGKREQVELDEHRLSQDIVKSPFKTVYSLLRDQRLSDHQAAAVVTHLASTGRLRYFHEGRERALVG